MFDGMGEEEFQEVMKHLLKEGGGLDTMMSADRQAQARQVFEAADIDGTSLLAQPQFERLLKVAQVPLGPSLAIEVDSRVELILGPRKRSKGTVEEIAQKDSNVKHNLDECKVELEDGSVVDCLRRDMMNCVTDGSIFTIIAGDDGSIDIDEWMLWVAAEYYEFDEKPFTVQMKKMMAVFSDGQLDENALRIGPLSDALRAELGAEFDAKLAEIVKSNEGYRQESADLRATTSDAQAQMKQMQEDVVVQAIIACCACAWRVACFT